MSHREINEKEEEETLNTVVWGNGRADRGLERWDSSMKCYRVSQSVKNSGAR